MPEFNILEMTDISTNEVSKAELVDNISENLSENYKREYIKVKNNEIVIKGNIKGVFKRAITKAKINIIEKEGEFILKAEGSSSMGWLKILGSLFIVFLFLILFPLSIIGFIPVFIIYGILILEFVITYLISKNKPKEYIEEALFSTIKTYS